MPRSLPPRPHLDWLRKAAKERLADLRATRPGARLASAQFDLAREYGFASWRALKAHVGAQSPTAPIAESDVAAFLRDVGEGRLDDVRRWLDAEPRLVNAVGPHPFWGGRPQALHLAVEARRHDLMDLLLERGADADGENDGYDHWSPLMLALHRSDDRAGDALLAHGAHIGLLEALMLGDDERVIEELGHGTLPDVAPNGGSLLAFARTPIAIDRLLDLGASATTKDRWGSTPIDAMSRLGGRGHALVRHLEARGVMASAVEYARLGDLSALERLAGGSSGEVRTDAVLMGAVDFGHHALVSWLLSQGANVNARSQAASHHTALHSAAWNGDVEMVHLLVEAGADVTARDAQYGTTPAHWATTSATVTNNARCGEVAQFLERLR